MDGEINEEGLCGIYWGAVCVDFTSLLGESLKSSGINLGRVTASSCEQGFCLCLDVVVGRRCFSFMLGLSVRRFWGRDKGSGNNTRVDSSMISSLKSEGILGLLGSWGMSIITTGNESMSDCISKS